MKDINFFSNNKYLYLPTKRNPKVALAVDSSELATNAFKLYNPFSSKAKKFKRLVKFFVIKFNALFKIFTKKENKSEFIVYLEKELNKNIVSSVYFATAKDKVVLQLQNNDARIIGYLKFPLNDIGLKHIQNEINAIKILSKKKIIEPYILAKEYKNIPFFLLSELNGDIGIMENNSIVLNIINRFKRDKSYILTNHPRILEMKTILNNLNMKENLDYLNELCLESKLNYQLVYEHGDFAPWNIVKVKNKYVPFDFEYFIEDGLEYLDLIKYYYQIGKLLQGKDSVELKEYIFGKVDFKEFDLIYEIFLIKEDMIKKLENL